MTNRYIIYIYIVLHVYMYYADIPPIFLRLQSDIKTNVYIYIYIYIVSSIVFPCYI